jgi:hypothetical protein
MSSRGSNDRGSGSARRHASAATLFQREPGGAWIATAHTDGALVLPGLDIALPLADVYEGLTFPPPETPG